MIHCTEMNLPSEMLQPNSAGKVYLDAWLSVSRTDKMAIDEVFKALADPTRRRILRMLAHGEMTAGQIAESFSISAPSMSHHFNVLKSADLIRGRRDGQQILYSLDTTVVQDAMTLMLDVFQKQDKSEQTDEN